MRRLSLLTVLLLLVSLAAGCTKTKSTISTYCPETGRLLKTTTVEHTDETAYYSAQANMAKEHAQAVLNQKPLLKMVAHDGQEIVLRGVKSLEVYHNSWKGKPTQVKQWENQYLKVGGQVLFGAIAAAALINAQNRTADIATKGIENAGSSYSGSYNNPSGQSGVVSGSGSVAPVNTPSTTTTTTTGTTP